MSKEVKKPVTKAKMRAEARKSAKRKNQMLWVAGVSAALVLAIVAIFLLIQTTTPTQSTLAREVTVAQAKEKMDAGAFMLDVREPYEWEEVHIPGATLIPLGELDERLGELPRDQEIVVVCRSGNRSADGRDILLDAGFTQVTSMAGGMNEWVAANYPTTDGP